MNEGTQLTNNEVIELLELDNSVIEKLQSKEAATYQATANQFLTALVNKIVYQTVDGFGWVNPLRKFDSFPINYGDTIENVYVETPKGYNFNPDATDPFTKAQNNVKALYATINYERQYQATIQDSLLRRAALNEYGFMNIINMILKQLTTSKNVEEYYATIAMLNNPELFGNSITGEDTNKQFAELDLSTYDTDEKKYQELTKTIGDITGAFKLPSKAYNALGVLTASNEEDIVLIIKRSLLNSINFEFLQGVYNLDKVKLLDRIVEVESFQVQNEDGELVGEDLGFMVIDSKAFDNHVALEDGGLIYNPKGKYTNHFMNLWKIIAFKYFYNAVAYKVKFE